MTAALEQAYRNQLLQGRFPACVLHLHLPEHLVDVNVHPAKTEVRCLREQRCSTACITRRARRTGADLRAACR